MNTPQNLIMADQVTASERLNWLTPKTTIIPSKPPVNNTTFAIKILAALLITLMIKFLASANA